MLYSRTDNLIINYEQNELNNYEYKFITFIKYNEYLFIIKLGEKQKMPNKDGTGPNGNGPKTGRQMGNCEGKEPQELPRGRGQGRGFGKRGCRRRNCD